MAYVAAAPTAVKRQAGKELVELTGFQQKVRSFCKTPVLSNAWAPFRIARKSLKTKYRLS